MIALSETPLRGCRVWVTRPHGQAERLCDLINAAGGEAVHFPLIVITAVADEASQKEILAAVNDYDAVIFISRNAVEYAWRLLPALTELLKKISVFAVGAASLQALTEQGVNKISFAPDEAGSDALLQLEPLQAASVAGKKILIIRGQGGRERLANVLQQRGAEVHYAEVYHRTCPAIAPERMKYLWRDNKPDAIVVTSVEGLHNLLALTGRNDRELLLDTQLVVISERLRRAAAALGFTLPARVAGYASDQGLLQAIVQSAGMKQL